MKVKEIIENVLLEKEKGKLKLFYKIDISITGKEEINIKKNGILSISDDDADNIQTIDDLLEYGKEHNIIDDVVKEIILNLSQGQEIGDLIDTNDKLQISLDYGLDKTNSIGLKVNKLSGNNNIVIVMKKNNNLIPGDFSLQDINKQIVYFRNSVLGK